MSRRLALAPLAAVALCLGAAAQAAPASKDLRPKLEKAPDGTPIVVLHLAPCLIRELESRALPFSPKKPGDCEALNRASLPVRRDGFLRLRLPAGRYIFRVINADAPWPAGFELRGEVDPGLPKTRGDGIAPGIGKDFRIELKPGRYLLRCPISPTPDYRLLVEG